MNEQAYQSLPNIVTEQIVIETKTSARMIPVTADKKGIDEINRALERAKKVEELLWLYHKLLKYIGLYNASTYCTKETLKDLEQKVKTTQKEIKQKEKELEEMK